MGIWTSAALALMMPAAEPTTPFGDIPNVTIASYEVAGRDAAAIRRSIDGARPTDTHDGKRVDGLTTWAYQWRWHRDAHGTCTVAPEDVVFRATVAVPRLADGSAAPKLRERFDRYLQSLLAHEDGHVRNAWEHRGDIVAAINQATCATADAAAKAALKAIAAHDIEYDKATRHGSTTILPLN